MALLEFGNLGMADTLPDQTRQAGSRQMDSESRLGMDGGFPAQLHFFLDKRSSRSSFLEKAPETPLHSPRQLFGPLPIQLASCEEAGVAGRTCYQLR